MDIRDEIPRNGISAATDPESLTYKGNTESEKSFMYPISLLVAVE
jgi:hypothetical protein